MLDQTLRDADSSPPLLTSPATASPRTAGVEADMMLVEIERLMAEQPVAFAASDIGQSSFRAFCYLLSVPERLRVLELRLQAMRDIRCRDKYSDDERESFAQAIVNLKATPPEAYPVQVSAEDAMLHGDAITAQLLASEYLCDPESESSPEDIGADLSPYTLDAIDRMRLTPRESVFIDPFETDYRPPVYIERVVAGEVVDSAWMDARENDARG